jgi:hypothetical protein
MKMTLNKNLKMPEVGITSMEFDSPSGRKMNEEFGHSEQFNLVSL